MPIYAFRCESCGHTFDELTSFSRQDEVICPQCAGQVKRVYEGPCAFGAKSTQGGKGCSGQCSGCAGCGH